jgi:hypothetical protein
MVATKKYIEGRSFKKTFFEILFINKNAYPIDF